MVGSSGADHDADTVIPSLPFVGQFWSLKFLFSFSKRSKIALRLPFQ
jgi:hypothetical protein